MKLYDLIDAIFPMLERESTQEKNKYKSTRDAARAEEEKLVSGLSSDEAQMKEYLEAVEKLVEKEDSRRTSVDARLTSIVGLTSIAATVVLTALFAMAAGTMPLPEGMAKWILIPGCFYLALQLFAALYAAIKGLSRASYEHETASDLLPSEKLAPVVFLRRCISNKLRILEQHREENNKKVNRMAVAHVAVRNFLFLLLMLAGASSWMAFNREPPKDEVLSTKTMNKVCAAKANPVASVSLTSSSGVQAAQSAASK